MKILILGGTSPSAFERACARGFEKLGHEVMLFETKPQYLAFFRRKWWDLGPVSRCIADTITNINLFRTAVAFSPDLVFFSKCENIRSEVFTLIKRKVKSKIAIWNWDNPFNANVSSYQVLRHIQKSDIYFIWARYLIDPLISAGAKRVEFLPFAFEPTSFPESDILPDEWIKWRSDVCFVGTWDKDREAALLPLAGQGFDLAIYGQGWTRYLMANSPLRAHVRADSIWMQDVVKAFKGAKIVLNLLRKHNWKGHNFRTMEAAGIGGGVLATPWTSDQASVLFQEGHEILCFDGPTPTLEWVKATLGRGAELQKIAAAGKQRVLTEHLLEHRLEQIVNRIKEEL